MTADERLARIETRLDSLTATVETMTAKIDVMRDEHAELRGALGFARWAAGLGGASGIAGVIAWVSTLIGSAPPPHQ